MALADVVLSALPIAATVVFFALLVWYLIRYFTESAGRPLPMIRTTGKQELTAPWYRVLGLAVGAFALSRFALFLGAVWEAYLEGSLTEFLQNPLRFWVRWDAPHYIGLIENWYVDTGDARLHIVFFPLYPAVCRAIWLLIGGDATVIALCVSNGCFLGCLYLMYRVTEQTYGHDRAEFALLLFAFSPLTVFCSVPYTESMFLLTTLGAVCCARRKRFGLAVFLGALSANTRMVGAVTAVPIFYEMLRVLPKKSWKAYLISVGKVLPVLLGVAAYLCLNWEVTGDPLRFLTYQSEHWGQNFGSLWNTLRYSLTYARDFSEEGYRIGVWIPQCVGILLFLVIFIWGWRRAYAGDMGYSLIAYYISVAPTWLLSGPRYLTALYALYPLLSALIPGKLRWAGLVVCAVLCFVTGGLYAVRGCIL